MEENLGVVEDGKKLTSIIYVIYGLIDIIIFAMANFFSLYLGILGILCFTTGFFLWKGKPWSADLAIASGLLSLTVGVSTLYASMGFVGFSQNFNVQLLHIILIGYSIFILIITFYVIVKRKQFQAN